MINSTKRNVSYAFIDFLASVVKSQSDSKTLMKWWKTVHFVESTLILPRNELRRRQLVSFSFAT